MRIIFDENIPGLAERLASALPSSDFEGLPAKEITPERVRDADALVVRTRTRCDASLLAGSKVSLVATATIGCDHIDRKWCETNGITVANAPGCNAPAVMQYVAASLAAASFDPLAQTLGVVGKGNIGSLIAALYRSAGCNVIVSDPPAVLAGRTDEEFLPLNKLLSQADAITFHVPLTSAYVSPFPTTSMLSPQNISQLRPGAVIINASRGAVLNERVITDYASEYRLVIDTWPFEDSPVARLKSVSQEAFIATPHIAGYSRQGKERATRSVIESLNRHFFLSIPTEGLADYSFRDQLPSLAEVAASYDPLADSAFLKAHPEDFEKIRNSYKLREEA